MRESGVVGVIGGTGLGDALVQHISQADEIKPDDIVTPFGRPSGPILTGVIGANRVAFINRHGPGHIFSPSKVPCQANIFALKAIGATSIIASGAVGSLQAKIEPGHLVVVDQFIDKTYRRPDSFFDNYGAVHCEFSHPVCSRLKSAVLKSAKSAGTTVHQAGCYVCMEGPLFSSRAESLMHRTWGGDLIGMTAMPEAKLARQAQMCYVLIALVSDYDCWKEHDAAKKKTALLEEIIANLGRATQSAVAMVKSVLGSGQRLCDDGCPCRRSLELAVWTKPDAIDPAEKKKLKTLFE